MMVSIRQRIRDTRVGLPEILTALLLSLYTGMVLALGSQVDTTVDEKNYIAAGRVLAMEGWAHPATVLHGPLPFYANQTYVHSDDFPLVDDHGRTILPREVLRRGRLGMLPFGLLCALLIHAWASRLWGRWAAVFGLAIYVSHPLMPAYGALVAVDMAQCAGVLLSLFTAWNYANKPALWRAGAVGVAVGAALATKYLALLVVPVALIAVPVSAYRCGRGRLHALLATALATGTALTALWACYGFAVEPAPSDPASYQSHIAEAIEIPGLDMALGLLPEPWVRGIDFQLNVGSNTHSTYLRGRYAPGHKDYYLWTFLTKTPEWILALCVLGFAFGIRSLRRGPPRKEVQAALWIIVPACLLLLVYISGFTSLQLGVRYMLPVFPLGAVLLAGLAPALERSQGNWSVRPMLLILGLGFLFATGDAVRQWPNLLAYTNVIGGGPAESWRSFRDSNTEWGQTHDWGLRQIEERSHTKVIGLLAGPQLGQLALALQTLTRVDTEDSTRARHWIDIFEPSEVVGTSWYVFNVDAESWKQRIEGLEDPRRQLEFAYALLAAGRHKDAALAASPLRGKLLQTWKKFRHRVGVKKGKQKDRLLAARTWIGIGRGDKALEVMQGIDQQQPSVGFLMAKALVIEGRHAQAETTLTAAVEFDPAALPLHVSLLQHLKRPEQALALLTEKLHLLDPTPRARMEIASKALKAEVAYRIAMRRVLGSIPMR